MTSPLSAFHTRIVLSREPETIRLPSGENATEKTQSVWPLNGPEMISPLSTLHTRIVQSSEPETLRLPSGENATDDTEAVWPLNGPEMTSPLAAFHTRIVRSSEAETMRFPSGENATDRTDSVWSSNGPEMTSPLTAFHTQIVLSCEPETMRFPSGRNMLPLSMYVLVCLPVTSVGGRTKTSAMLQSKVNPPTAYGMLTGFVNLEAGDYVIQNGANSAVSLAYLITTKVNSQYAREICRLVFIVIFLYFYLM